MRSKAHAEITLLMDALAFSAHKHRNQRRDRKRLQIEHAKHLSRRARLVKLADKICNVRDMAAHPPQGWELARRREYYDWAKKVIDEIRGTHARLEAAFDEAYAARP